jgi:hypothetical protein
MPMMRTWDGSGLVSDSGGIVRYKFEAKIWDVYSNADEPYWYFPEGIYVEQFDSLFQVERSIEADTAYYFDKQELWHAIGNVVVKNTKGETFETSELFWDQKVPQGEVNAFYTHRQVKITKPDGTFIYGHDGFAADQSLTLSRLYGGSGELLIEESDDTTQPDAILSDNTQPGHDE